MANVNPQPGQAAAVEDDPKKPYKAYVATALTAVSSFILYWVADEDPFTAKEAGQGVVSALMASGVVGAGTFLKANPKRRRR
jgi:hypothetical protein